MKKNNNSSHYDYKNHNPDHGTKHISGDCRTFRGNQIEVYGKKNILFYATIISYQFSYIEHLIIVHNLHLNRSELQMSVSHFLYRWLPLRSSCHNCPTGNRSSPYSGTPRCGPWVLRWPWESTWFQCSWPPWTGVCCHSTTAKLPGGFPAWTRNTASSLGCSAPQI